MPIPRNPGGKLTYHIRGMGVRPKFSAGATEPILSKLLQGRKANVGAVASRPQEESATLSLSNGEQRAWGRKATERIMAPLCDVGRSAQHRFRRVAVRPEKAVPRDGCL